MKPIEYRRSCIITGETSYQVQQGEPQGTHSAVGVLQIGRVVWARSCEEYAPGQQISVYAEGVGVVRVESRLLRPTSVKL